MNNHYLNTSRFCRPRPEKTRASHRSTRRIHNVTADKFGFRLDRVETAEKTTHQICRNGECVVEVNSFEEAVTWLQGYEYCVVSTSEYAE